MREFLNRKILELFYAAQILPRHPFEQVLFRLGSARRTVPTIVLLDLEAKAAFVPVSGPEELGVPESLGSGFGTRDDGVGVPLPGAFRIDGVDERLPDWFDECAVRRPTKYFLEEVGRAREVERVGRLSETGHSMTRLLLLRSCQRRCRCWGERAGGWARDERRGRRHRRAEHAGRRRRTRSGSVVVATSRGQFVLEHFYFVAVESACQDLLTIYERGNENKTQLIRASSSATRESGCMPLTRSTVACVGSNISDRVYTGEKGRAIRTRDQIAVVAVDAFLGAASTTRPRPRATDFADPAQRAVEPWSIFSWVDRR